MNWIKLRLWLILAGINFILIGGSLVIFEKISQRLIDKERLSMMSIDEVNFHKKYMAELNHLRGPFIMQLLLGDEYNYENSKNLLHNYIYTQVGAGNETILIQGDSWAEGFVLGDGSRAYLNQFAQNYKCKFIVSGTGSYAPSPMTVQLRILRDSFAVSPKYVIATIDQTDIGDELFRYRSQRAQNENGQLIIKPFGNEDLQAFNMNILFEQSEILSSDTFAIVKLALINIKKYLYKYKYQEGAKSIWKEVVSPLYRGVTEAESDYFTQVLNEYIDTVFDNNVEKLIFVTHFHYLHINKTYKGDVADLVKRAVSKSKHKDNIYIISFKPSDYSHEELENIFRKNDAGSHLTEEAHAEFYTKRILNKAEKLFK